MSNPTPFRFVETAFVNHVHEIMLTRRGRAPSLRVADLSRLIAAYTLAEFQAAIDELVSDGRVLDLGDASYAVSESAAHITRVALAMPAAEREAMARALAASLAVPT